MIAPRPDRVQIWASQLAANNFPPVCALTGRPAEKWQKFRFVTAPGWAYAFLLLLLTGVGLLLIFIIMRAVSRTASGHLPLTRAASNRIRNANLAGVGIAILWLALWVFAFTLGSDSGFGLLFGLGLLVMVFLAIYWMVIRPQFGIGGKVLAVQPGQRESIVVLDRVHPAFVAAVAQQHTSWMAKTPESN